jgi:deoxyribonuclease V
LRERSRDEVRERCADLEVLTSIRKQRGVLIARAPGILPDPRQSDSRPSRSPTSRPSRSADRNSTRRWRTGVLQTAYLQADTARRFSGERGRESPAVERATSSPAVEGHYAPVAAWPLTREALIEEQRRLSEVGPPAWRFQPQARIGGVFVCFVRGEAGPGRAGDPAWAAACVERELTTVRGSAGAPYEPGLLALRQGSLLEAAVRALQEVPDVLLVDATGRDHPRRAGLALQLGAVLELPTVGVTHRPLVATGEWPADERGARSPLLLDGELVGYWLRAREGTRPLAAHAAWRTDPATAAAVVLSASRFRTPEPLRSARRRAREARAMASSNDLGQRRELWRT